MNCKVKAAAIINQKAFLENYAKRNNFTNIRHFTDDVLFKDKGVRFIAINNGIDSDKQGDNDFPPFLNIMNENDARKKRRFFYVDREKREKHWYFEPSSLPDVINYVEVDAELTSLLIQAHRALGRLEGMSQYIPQIDRLEEMVIRNEVCMSCAIENFAISCTGMFDNTLDTVSKCCASNLFQVTKALEKQPLSIDSLCMLHGLVMNGVTNLEIGKLRERPIYVHPDFVVTMQEYNPPLPADLIGFLDAMVKFAHTEDQIDALMKAALVYYQFETIYPFNTGNDLVARLLPNSILLQEGILSRPLLSLSNYFYQYHDECAKKFTRIHHFGCYVDWIKFFIQGVITSAECTISQLNLATSLREENLRKIASYEKSTTVLFAIYDFIEQKPIVNIQDIADNRKISYNTAAKYVKIMESVGILKQINGQSRYRLFAFEDYLNIFDT